MSTNSKPYVPSALQSDAVVVPTSSAVMKISEASLSSTEATTTKIPFDLSCPYTKGAHMEFIFAPDDTGSHPPMPLQAAVVTVFTPFTNSQVLLVDVITPSSGLPEQVIVKLYDRRYIDAREHHKLPWSPDIERAAVKRWTAIRADLEEDDYEDLDDDDYDEARWEEYMSRYTKTLFHTEQEAYDRLRHFQGTLLPKLHGSVELQFAFEGRTLDQHMVPGIVLEYIPAPSLDELPDPSIVGNDQRLVRETLDAVVTFESHGVLHSDIRAHNIKISLAPDKMRLVIYDFGVAILRQEGQDDDEWARLVHVVDDVSELQFVFTRKGIRELSPLFPRYPGQVICERSAFGLPTTYWPRWYTETDEPCDPEMGTGVHKRYKMKPEVYEFFKDRQEVPQCYLYPRPGSPDFSFEVWEGLTRTPSSHTLTE